MTVSNIAIRFDFQTGKFSNLGLADQLGVRLMQFAGWVTSPIAYVGLSFASRIIKRVVPVSRPIEITLYADTRFEIPFCDRYYGRLLRNAEPYAHDLLDFLMAIRDADYVFVDCGANYGYLSAIVTGAACGHKTAIAIEADPENFGILQRNREINGGRFDILNNAVFSRSGARVEIFGARHEARSICPEAGEGTGRTVQTLALDDLAGWRVGHGDKPIILKLDVEGVEIEAMDGATNLAAQDCLVIFECHGADKTHAVSRYFIDTLGMRVFVSKHDGLHELFGIDEIAACKTNTRVGYDFFATTSAWWISRIDGLTYA